jgi:hypothetical protein
MIEVTLTGSGVATAEGITVDYEKRARGAPICDLARKLVDAGYDPVRLLSITRNGTLCFKPMTLAMWAKLTITEGDNSDHPIEFRKWSPWPPRSTQKQGKSMPRVASPPKIENALLVGTCTALGGVG